jgi:hypothetical protein
MQFPPELLPSLRTTIADRPLQQTNLPVVKTLITAILQMTCRQLQPNLQLPFIEVSQVSSNSTGIIRQVARYASELHFGGRILP